MYHDMTSFSVTFFPVDRGKRALDCLGSCRALKPSAANIKIRWDRSMPHDLLEFLEACWNL